MERLRQKPKRLAEKLHRIRTALGLSQNEMIKFLGFEGELIQAHISAYERKHENRVPPLGVVLQYARSAGVAMEVLVDDSLNLPAQLPVRMKSGELKDPARLAEKLTYVRKVMNLSQDELVRQLGLEDRLTREEISKYERGLRVPSLLTLLSYARTAGLIVDDLIDDKVALPEELPTNSKRRKS